MRLKQSDIDLRLRSHSGFDRIPMFVKTIHRTFALHPLDSNFAETCISKQVLQPIGIRRNLCIHDNLPPHRVAQQNLARLSSMRADIAITERGPDWHPPPSQDL
jgi:hypothetical protein